MTGEPDILERVVIVLNPGKCGSTWLMVGLNVPPHVTGDAEYDFFLFLTRPAAEQWNKRTLENPRYRTIGDDASLALDDKLRALYREVVPETGYLVDKTPSNLIEWDRFSHLFARSKIICLHRDPRDAYVSKELFHRNVLKVREAGTAQLGEADYLASSESFVELVFGRAAKVWREQQRLVAAGVSVLELRYEDLVRDFPGTVRGVLGFLGVEPTPAIDAHLAETAQAKVGKVFRKGGTGDWKEFLAGDAAKGVIKERYGDLLVELGYETGQSW